MREASSPINISGDPEGGQKAFCGVQVLHRIALRVEHCSMRLKRSSDILDAGKQLSCKVTTATTELDLTERTYMCKKKALSRSKTRGQIVTDRLM